MNKKFLFVKTFGCQMNVYDSNRMVGALAVHGYEPTEAPEKADVILLNTCHIREKASEKLFSEIGRLAKVRKKGSLIVVAGCVVQAEGKEILRRSPLIDIAIGPQNYHQLPELIAKYVRDQGRVIQADFPAESKFDNLPMLKTSPANAFLAIQEGCDNFCSYCVVPYTRGCEYSRPSKEILAEAKALVKAGAKEIMLLGQNVNCWHGDKGRDLGDLIRDVAKINGLERIRYTTSYPSKITQNLINTHADTPKLMPYIHLPIQAGSDRILKAMNRQYTVAEYEKIIADFRSVRPDIAISSDFIVGFPGETEEDFEQTLAVVERVQYASSFSFKFSARPGTPASLMKNQIPEEVKTRRLMKLQKLLQSQQRSFNESTVGKELDVLLTECGKMCGQLVGYTPYMQGTVVKAPKSQLGKIMRVKIIGASATALTGKILK
ncbi:MAG: tRNA (N6-isopentenyl adenosine(37)-C2)-methylthiotransferase MiaB [Alphaproteobacteria bacterium]|nr:tRNA (N6-isopentenyl adenosine(37)-C2)-methylthiotransferase MiaB [Alphaproteobacteria bacterium]